MTSIQDALQLATRQLQPYSPSPKLDGEVLLAHLLNKNRSFLYAHPEFDLSKELFFTYQKLLAKRTLGVPVAYLTGTREFWSLPLNVNPETLIPRPETELVVELTLDLLGNREEAFILDLGTGSGAIALALAKERPQWKITACDCSPGALNTAQENAIRLGLHNIEFFHSDWFTNIQFNHPFHAIVSNPPYIAANDPHLQQGDVRFEPPLALVGGKTGLNALEAIIEQAYQHLDAEGILLIEHGYDQKSAVMALLEKFHYQDLDTWKDTQGHNRVSGGRRGS